MKRSLVLTKTLLLSFIRDRQSVFFTLALPLIFLIIFGFMYSGEWGEAPDTRLIFFGEENLRGSKELAEILANTERLKVIQGESIEQVQKEVGRLQAHMGLVWQGEKLKFFLNPTRIQNNPYYQEIARGIAAAFDTEITGLLSLIETEIKEVNTGRVFSALEYMLPGIIAIAVVSSGLFAITGVFLHIKERGVLKRLVATPMSRISFILSLMITRLLAALAGTIIILIFSYFVFRVTFEINWILFLPFVFISTLGMMALGVLITLFIKRADSATQFSGLLTTFMIFFSGVYLPVEFLPDYMQRIAVFLPLTYVNQGLRHAMNIEPMPLQSFFLMSFLIFIVSLGLIFTMAGRGKWQDS